MRAGGAEAWVEGDKGRGKKEEGEQREDGLKGWLLLEREPRPSSLQRRWLNSIPALKLHTHFHQTAIPAPCSSLSPKEYPVSCAWIWFDAERWQRERAFGLCGRCCRGAASAQRGCVRTRRDFDRADTEAAFPPFQRPLHDSLLQTALRMADIATMDIACRGARESVPYLLQSFTDCSVFSLTPRLSCFLCCPPPSPTPLASCGPTSRPSTPTDARR